MRMLKMISCFMVLCLFFNISASACESHKMELDEILSYYQEKIAYINSLAVSPEEKTKVINKLCEERIQNLVEGGYEVYCVDPSNYDDIENILKTDFDAIGLNNKCSFLAIISGKEHSNIKNPNGINSTIGQSFQYTYQGQSYTLRYLTITAVDGYSGYAVADYVDLLNSNSLQLIENCLDTLISAYLSYVWTPLGTVASICGLSISDFIGGSTSSTLIMHGGVNWTRIYTQLYDSYSQSWIYGCSVERAYVLTHMSGTYYNANTNQMTPVPQDQTGQYVYSSNYNNYNWRKSQAVIAYLYSNPCFCNETGDIPFKYGDSVVLTIHEYIII